MTVPYEEATTGARAREEIVRLLRNLGCESVGFMDDFEKGELLLAFSHRGRKVHLMASAKGWAAMFLKQRPYDQRYHRSTREEYERKALKQGLIAINSILRDWVKGQVTAVECGILSFNAVFMPYMLAHDGRPVIEHILAHNLLPAPEGARP